MRNVRFLCTPVEEDLYLDEIIDYADSNVCVSIEDLGMKIETITVECDHSTDAVRIANMKMFNKCKGYNFVIVGITW